MSQTNNTNNQRTELRISRLSHGFLLKEMSYTQHFSHVYVARNEALRDRIIQVATAQHPTLKPARILELSSDEQKLQKEQKKKYGDKAGAFHLSNRASGGNEMVGKERLLIGTLYKNMPLFRPFLKDYTAELVRLEAGEDDGDEDGEGGGDGGDGGMDEDGGMDGLETQEITGGLDQDGAAHLVSSTSTANLTPQQIQFNTEFPRICSEKDSLILEDGSGRIELGGNIDPHKFATGVIVGVAGAVNERGIFVVARVCTAECSRPSYSLTTAAENNSDHRTHRQTPPPPVYIAFVSGLSITGLGAAPASIELLVDFLSGNLGDDDTITLASQIGRVVVGGGLIVETEESKLAQKVKLEPADHSRLSEVAAGKTPSHSASCAGAMRYADRLLSLLARTVPVEVMPGSADATNCFLPQQPIHPLMLANASKSNSLRLVTNPFQFEAQVTSEASAAPPQKVSFLVSSGQNVSDVVRQTTLTSVETMASLLRWGHLCPTAPATMPCFPFKQNDPFVISEAPNCFVACNQQSFESKYDEARGIRFISVPKFVFSGQIVLVNVNSPHLDTKVITLALSDE